MIFQRSFLLIKKEYFVFPILQIERAKCVLTDGVQKNNPYIPRIIPRVYYLNAQRNMGEFQDVVLMLQEDEILRKMRAGCCMFDQAKECNRCFSCIGLINKKKTEELNAFETAKLLEYKLYCSNLDAFSREGKQNLSQKWGT